MRFELKENVDSKRTESIWRGTNVPPHAPVVMKPTSETDTRKVANNAKSLDSRGISLKDTFVLIFIIIMIIMHP